MSSSFRKVAPRREHKERSQPASRARLGLLEKKKDYILRARDYQSKAKRVMALREKGRLRNPDEYYFGMISSSTKDGIHVATRADPGWTPEMIALMKSQDLAYVKTIKHLADKKLQKLAAAHPHLLLNTEQKKRSRHFVFGSKGAEDSSELTVQEQQPHDAQDAKKEQSGIKKEITARQQQKEKLAKIEKHLINQKLLAGKGKKRRVGQDSSGNAIYKWKPERKK